VQLETSRPNLPRSVAGLRCKRRPVLTTHGKRNSEPRPSSNLESESDRPIALYVNSPLGGSVTAGLAIYDCMQYIVPRSSQPSSSAKPPSNGLAPPGRRRPRQEIRAPRTPRSCSTSPSGGHFRHRPPTSRSTRKKSCAYARN